MRWPCELASQPCSTIASWSVGRIDGTAGEVVSSAVATAFRGVGGWKNLVSKTGLLRPLLALAPAGGTKTITSLGPLWLRPCHRLQHRQCMLLFGLLCCSFRFPQLCPEVLLKKTQSGGIGRFPPAFLRHSGMLLQLSLPSLLAWIPLVLPEFICWVLRPRRRGITSE